MMNNAQRQLSRRDREQQLDGLIEAYWDEPNGEYCPKCGAPLVVHGKKSPVTKCSECDYIK